MGIKVGWDNPNKTTIRYEFNGKWDVHTFEQAVEQSFVMTESVNHEVHVIMDMSHSKEIPDGALLYFKRKLSVLPYNRGVIVFAGCDTAAMAMVRMLTRVHSKYSHRLMVAKTVSGARLDLRKVSMEDVLQPETPVFAAL
jgi:hypothetical protein